MTDLEILAYCGDSGQRWAEKFRETAIKLGYSDMDEGWLIGWFANAIECSYDVRKQRLVERLQPTLDRLDNAIALARNNNEALSNTLTDMAKYL